MLLADGVLFVFVAFVAPAKNLPHLALPLRGVLCEFSFTLVSFVDTAELLFDVLMLFCTMSPVVDKNHGLQHLTVKQFLCLIVPNNFVSHCQPIPHLLRKFNKRLVFFTIWNGIHKTDS